MKMIDEAVMMMTWNRIDVHWTLSSVGILRVWLWSGASTHREQQSHSLRSFSNPSSAPVAQ
jgi:hypothetical protein